MSRIERPGHEASSRPRAPRGLLAVAALVLVPAAGIGDASAGPEGRRPYAEPRGGRNGLEREGWARGEARSDPAGARPEVLERTLERLRREPGPPDEVYALVSVTDRHTGERALFTRGVPDPSIPAYLEDMRKAPPGVAFFQAEHASADDEVEIVIRSVHRRPRREEPGALTGPEQEELDLRLRNAEPGLTHRINGGLRRRVLSGEIDLSSGELVPVVIGLRDVPPLRLPRPAEPATGGLHWTGLELAAGRERAVIHRKQTMARFQEPVRTFIESIGGSVRYASWTSGSVRGRVPANRLVDLAGRPDVFRIDLQVPIVPHTHFTGQNYSRAMDSIDFDTHHSGLNGPSGKHSYSSRVVLSFLDEYIDQENPAFLRRGGFNSRGSYYECSYRECQLYAPIFILKDHGTQVAQLAVGDFMDGQDPLVSNPRKYTGTCGECRFIFIADPFLDDIELGADKLCELAVDVFSFSVGEASTDCDGSGVLDSVVESLVSCDAVFVNSAGNSGSDTNLCTATPPADHPWTFAVGGVKTDDDCSSAGDWYTSACEYDPGASRGGGDYNSGAGTATIIDMAAPYRLGNLIIPETRDPVEFESPGSRGTSYAAPLVAGLMGRFLDWWNVHISTSLFYDNRLRNYFLLFGDRSSNSDGVNRRENGFSSRWGAGRAGLVPFDVLTHWDILRADCELGRNETCSIFDALDGNIEFYKLVVWHDGKDYSNEPAIGITLNPAGCSAPTISTTRHDSKHMAVYTRSVSSGHLDGCIGVQITIENIASGSSGSRRFHVGAYGTDQDERNY